MSTSASASAIRPLVSSASLRRPTIPASVLCLVVIALAMILPMVHVWLQGADRLVAGYVAQRRASGQIPVSFLYVSKQVAENKIEFTPLIDAIYMSVTMAILILAVWALARWQTVRLTLATVANAVSIALLAELAFYVVLYLVVWGVRGADHLGIDWRNVAPTNLASLVGAGLLRVVLFTMSVGALVRFIVLARVLRTTSDLRPRSEWLIAGGASLAVAAVTVVSRTL